MEVKKPVTPIRRECSHGSTILDPLPPANGRAVQPIQKVTCVRDRRRGPRCTSPLPATTRKFEWRVYHSLRKLSEEFRIELWAAEDITSRYLDERRRGRQFRAAARVAVLVLMFAVGSNAQDASYRASVAAVVAANTVDAATSWGAREANPMLGRTFDGRSVAIKAGLTSGMLFAEREAVRRGYLTKRKCAWINWAISGGLGFVAYRNSRMR